MTTLKVMAFISYALAGMTLLLGCSQPRSELALLLGYLDARSPEDVERITKAWQYGLTMGMMLAYWLVAFAIVAQVQAAKAKRRLHDALASKGRSTEVGARESS